MTDEFLMQAGEPVRSVSLADQKSPVTRPGKVDHRRPEALRDGVDCSLDPPAAYTSSDEGDSTLPALEGKA